MEKQKEFFAIYKNKEKEYIHEVIRGKSKKLVKTSLREGGFIVQGIFSQKDINSILNYEYTDVNVSDKTIEYLRDHLDFWEENKTKA